MDATIFALSSAPGRAGVAVYRISGPEAGPALQQITGRPLPRARIAARRGFHDAEGRLLDSGLALWFPGPESFTGEDVAELHGHGGRAAIAAMLGSLGRIAGLRLAEPGEFTRQAFENGKLDLTAAEGLGDLIDADTEAQRALALRQMGGELMRLYEGWRGELLRAMAHFEAAIDFPEDDLPDGLDEAVLPGLVRLHDEIAAHLDDNRRGERLRDGVSVAIIGPPNAGKSSLLNALARREAAIVSEIAGTTRDIIDVHLDLGGYPVIVADTAGLRESADRIESEGVRRALARAAEADLKLLILDAETWPNAPGEILGLIDDDTLIVVNKVDAKAMDKPAALGRRPVLPLSVKTGEGMPALLLALTGAVKARFDDSHAERAVLTRARHRAALEECKDALGRFLQRPPLAELAAEDLRLAARALGRITGRVDVEDVLDVIFREFCIGK